MNNKYFDILINLCNKALKNDEVPVAALIVCNGKIIAKAYNSRVNESNPLNHAEVKCILKASRKLGDWRLCDCDLYSTLEPCHMCREIIKESRIKNVYYLSKSNKKVNYKTKFSHVSSDLSTIYSNLLTDFFRKLR